MNRWMQSRLAIALVTLTAASCLGAGGAVAARDGDRQAPASQVTVCFRCDDWRAFGEGSDLDTREAEVCRRIVSIFREYGIPLTLGVTP